MPFKALISRSMLTLGLIWLSGYEVMAQCAQCKAAAATKDENGNLIVGGSLNTGVLYLLALPVFLPLIVGGVLWYLARQRRNSEHGTMLNEQSS